MSTLVLVTGAGGFLAGHLIAQLLEKKYRVRGTVRDISNVHRYRHLTSLPLASTNLELVQLNLTEDIHSSNWAKCFEGGVQIVFHLAALYPSVMSPFHSTNPDSELVRSLLDVSVGGTLKICELCHNTPSVKRLILTSCLDAVADSFVNGKEYNESDWNLVSTEKANPVAYSKTAAEMAAYRFFESLAESAVTENSTDTVVRDEPLLLISLIPGLMLGPGLTYQQTLQRTATWREMNDDGSITFTSAAPASPAGSSAASSSASTTSASPAVKATAAAAKKILPPSPSTTGAASGKPSALALPSASTTWTPRLSSSHQLFVTYLNGSNRGVANLFLNLSDVRDVATAHLIAAESSRVQTGRYIVASSKAISHLDLVQMIHDNFSEQVNVPTRRVPDRVARIAASFDKTGKGAYLTRNLGKEAKLDTSKATEVGMALRPSVQTIVDTTRFLLENNLVEPGTPQGCVLL